MKKLLLILLMTLSFWSFHSKAQNEFITTWETTDGSITIPTNDESGTLTYNYDITWTNLDDAGVGDGSATAETGDYTITGLSNGDIYQVEISGDFPRIYFNNTGDRAKLLTIEQWGNIAWSSMNNAFKGCYNMTYNATDDPDLTNVTSLLGMFSRCTQFNGDIGNWDVSNITRLDAMFQRASVFNQDISGWNTSSNTAISFMFQYAYNFNQDISGWDVSNVTNMKEAFREATNFNIDISDWNTANVTDMNGMFWKSGFNQDISSWNTSSVQNIQRMFQDNAVFNQDLSSWNTSSVTNMYRTFYRSFAFNQDLSSWNIEQVSNMDGMLVLTDLSVANYDATLQGWASQSVQSNVTLTSNGLNYCNAETARNTLINTYNWTISDAGLNCPNNSPSALSLSSNSIDENNAIDDIIGTFSTTDADGGDTHIYTLVSGTGDTDNASFSIDGEDLQAAEVFDFETKSSYSILVQTDDGNGGTFQEVFSITINDVTEVDPETAFITTWKTTDGQITIPTTGTGYNYDITWTNLDNNGQGDGSSTGEGGDYTISGLTNGDTYQIEITGDFPRIYFNNTGDKDKIQTIEQWGDIQWGSFAESFYGCSNLTYGATDTPDLSSVSNLRRIFSFCDAFNGDISNWNVQTVTNFFSAFENATSFDQDLSNWNVQSALYMAKMFKGASSFNSSISWDMMSVQTANEMFANSSFNQDISSWQFNSLDNMNAMFQNNAAFNQDISGWDVSTVTTMIGVFENASAFDQNLGNWDITSVTNMDRFLDNSGLSQANYDASLNSWVQLNNLQTDIEIGVLNLEYCDAKAARNTLKESFDWIINGDINSCPQAFITTWRTTVAGESITIPTFDLFAYSGYDYTVNWGDGTTESGFNGDATHTYANPGDYQVEITGDFPWIFFDGSGDKQKIISIDQWGDQYWDEMTSAFEGCSNLTYNASDAPIMVNVTTAGRMFSECVNLSPSSLNSWDFSGVEIANSMFFGCSNFNADLSGWNTVNLSDANAMFSGANAFNQNISGWNVANVTTIRNFLKGASSFDQELGSWNISNATDMSSMLDNSGLSIDNYDATLQGWSSQTVQANVTLGASSLAYCNAETARNTLTDTNGSNWTITDAGRDCSAVAFITTWQTTDGQITIPTTGTGYNYDITWTNLDNDGQGDGSSNGEGGDYTVSGLTNGDTYQIEITGDFPRIYFNNTGDKDKIQTIEQWGGIVWASMEAAFYGCSNLTYNATDKPDLSSVTSLKLMLTFCSSFNGNISSWDVSNIELMEDMFNGATNFNQPLNSWDVGSVLIMRGMFKNASSFNQELNNWDVSNVTAMQSMFSGSNFNRAINNWNVSSVTSMQSMLGLCPFNQDISNWDVSSVTNMSYMFGGNQIFNHDISGWDVSSVNNFQYMFDEALAFNQSLADWDISSATSLKGMFKDADSFNQDISSWVLNNVKNIRYMFWRASSFNQDISSWNTSNVNDAGYVFNSANSFNQDLSSWDISNVTDMSNMLDNSGLSTANYDATLQGWAAQTVQSNVTLDAVGISYCAGEAARNTLTTDFGWTITDAGKDCSNSAPTAISLSSNSIDENNAIGDVIGIFSTTDADGADTHTYTFVAGTGDTDNASFSIDGEDLQAAEVFEFETKSSYSIRVQTDDGNGGTFEESFTISINDIEEKEDQNITFEALSNKIYGDANFSLTASSSSNLEVSFEVVEGPVSLDGNEVSITGTGNVSIRAIQSGNEEYNPATAVEQSFEIAKADLTVSADNKEKTYGEALPEFTYQISGFVYGEDEGVLTNPVEFSTLADENSNVGEYDINASGAAAANYEISFESGVLTIVKASQEITFEPISDIDIEETTELALSASSTSGLDIDFEVLSGPATLSGNTLTLTGIGTISIAANQTGNENYEAAETATQSFDVFSSAKEDQTISFEPLTAKTYGDEAFELSETASSGLTVSFTSSDETVATIDGTTVTILTAGTTVITASQSGNDEYNPAVSVSQDLVINKADQEITIEAIEDKDIEADDFEVIATTNSGLELSYSIFSGPATINGNLVSLTGGTGTVEIEVSQTGNSNYNAASAMTTFEVVDDPCIGFEATAAVIQNVNCNGDANGSFEVSVTSGTAPFTYSIGNENQENGLFENQLAGSYEITVTDANGCTSITTVEITEPDAIEVTAETTDSNSIFGNGSISLTVTGGSGNYTFDWSNGEISANLTDLEIGEYTVTITDEAGCSTTESYTIGGVTANEEAFEINIYPNPVTDQVEVVHGEKVNKISLMDARGKIILQKMTSGKQSYLEMKALPAGLYFIRLDNGNLNRIIKQ